jgi:DNA primase
VRLENKGGRFWGLCPFHSEKSPSFTVDPEKKLYYCFGCHEGGSVLDFVMKLDKLSFPEALELVARKTGVELVREGGQTVDEGAGRRREELTDLYERVTKSFHYILLSKETGRSARDYLARRGVSTEMIKNFRLGYAPEDRNWLYNFLHTKS